MNLHQHCCKTQWSRTKYNIYKILALIPLLSQLNLSFTLKPCFLNIHFNIVYEFMPVGPERSVMSDFGTNFLYISVKVYIRDNNSAILIKNNNNNNKIFFWTTVELPKTSVISLFTQDRLQTTWNTDVIKGGTGAPIGVLSRPSSPVCFYGCVCFSLLSLRFTLIFFSRISFLFCISFSCILICVCPAFTKVIFLLHFTLYIFPLLQLVWNHHALLYSFIYLVISVYRVSEFATE
jgi:hypothetical protein